MSMGVEKMSGIYIPGAKIPDGDYVRVLMLHKDGTCVDGIGNVFKVIPVPPHGRLSDVEGYVGVNVRMMPGWKCEVDLIAPTIIPASEEG